jgi:hypothetical protein
MSQFMAETWGNQWKTSTFTTESKDDVEYFGTLTPMVEMK